LGTTTKFILIGVCAIATCGRALAKDPSDFAATDAGDSLTAFASSGRERKDAA
jgi:hypothetical protein